MNNNNYLDEIFLVMAPTGKAASNTYGSTLHSHKERLSLPVHKRFKDLDGKQLKFWKDKHKF